MVLVGAPIHHVRLMCLLSIQWNVRLLARCFLKPRGLPGHSWRPFHPGSWKNFARTFGGWNDESLTRVDETRGWRFGNPWNWNPKTNSEPKSIVPQKSLDSKNSFVQVLFVFVVVLFGKIWLNLQRWEHRTSEHRDVFIKTRISEGV